MNISNINSRLKLLDLPAGDEFYFLYVIAENHPSSNLMAGLDGLGGVDSALIVDANTESGVEQVRYCQVFNICRILFNVQGVYTLQTARHKQNSATLKRHAIQMPRSEIRKYLSCLHPE